MSINNHVKYHVNEHFYSVQGEGVHSGRAAYFIRLQGCDQKCHFCDSAGTWHPNWKPSNTLALDAKDTAQLAIAAHPAAFVVLTGGEPALYRLEPLVERLHEAGRVVHIETAGHRPLAYALDWVTMAPKLFATPPLAENWHRADEIKLVVECREQLQRDLATIGAAIYDSPKRPTVWLMPEWSQRQNSDVPRLIIEAVKNNPHLRAGYQMHKLFRADNFDPNANRALIPLGGCTIND